jgi:hypothetical protein
MIDKNKALKAVGFVLGVGVFFAFLFALGIVMGGAGHGSVFFAEAILAPWPLENETVLLGLASWIAIGTLLVFRDYLFCRIATAALLLLHYFSIVALWYRTDHSMLKQTFETLFLMILPLAVAYLGSQVLMWRAILRAGAGSSAHRAKVVSKNAER